jgi:hypothetical protein
VHNIERVGYICPRPIDQETGQVVTVMSVMKELAERRSEHGIPMTEIQMRSAGERMYCFERDDVPRGRSEFYEIKYPAKCM